MDQEIEQYVGNILDALSPYRKEFVVVGGICAALYHREQGEDIGEQLFTTDLDIGCPAEGIGVRERSLTEILKEVGFEEQLSGSEKGISKFDLSSDRGILFEVEFLLPARGSDPDSVGSVQNDLAGEKLRYLDLLLFEPEMIQLNLGNKDVSFRRPLPGLFIIHRILASEKRKDSEKRMKDYGYILDLIELFSDRFAEMKNHITRATKANREFDAWLDNGRKKLRTSFLNDSEPLEHALDRVPRLDENRAKALIEDFLDCLR